MRTLLENGKFVLQTVYDERFKAAATGCKWNDERRRWEVKVNLLSAAQIVSQAKPGDDVEAARAYIRTWDDPVPLVVPSTKEPEMPHQVQGTSRIIHRKRFFLTYDMGCVDGDAVVHINRAGRGFTIKLRELFRKFHGGPSRGRSWDLTIPTMIRSLCDGELHLNRVVKVLDRGVKPVVRVTLASGKKIRVTDDHEICVGQNKYREAKRLRVGDTVLANGKFIDSDGYVRLCGPEWRKHPRYTTGGLYEHIVVAEKMLGRKLRKGELVHHKDEDKQNNKPSNLEVTTKRKHSAHHGRNGGYKYLHGGIGGKGGSVCFLPHEDRVASVKPDGNAHVYDVVCADPHRNFVANGIIVHNCGKTLAVIGAAQELFKDGQIDFLLVVVPLSVFGSWERQFKRFCNVPYRIVHLIGNRKKRIARMEDVKTLRASFKQKRLIVGLVNYEALRLFADDLIKLKPGIVAFDESTFIKNRSAQMTKASVRISRAAQYATALTGTPISNNVGDLFAQLNAVSPEFVGDDYWNFARTFAKFGGFKGKEIVGIQNEKGLDWILKKVSLRVRKEEVLKLPERTWETREIELEDDQLDAYEKAEKEFYFAVAAVKKELASGAEKDPERRKHLVTVLIKNALARLLRCQQIASGHCKDEAGEVILWPENQKLKEVVRLAEESGDQRIVVFSRFVEDLTQGQKALEAAGFRAEVYHGKVKPAKRVEIENEFLKDQTSLKVVLAQVKTGGFGIDFSKASICTFFSNWFSWAVRDQAESRLHRLGQTRNVSIYDLIAKGTVDEIVLEMVLSKKSLSEVLFGRKIQEADDEAAKGFAGQDFEDVA